MLLLHQLIDQLKAEPAERWQSIGAALPSFQKFEVRNALDVHDEAVIEYAALLMDEDVLRLPFGRIYIELDYAAKPIWGGAVDRVGLAAIDEDPGKICVTCFVRYREEKRWAGLPLIVGWHLGKHRDDRWFYVKPWEDPVEGDADSLKDAALLLAQMVAAVVAFLDVKETRQESKSPPEKLNAQRAKKGRSPLFAHKVIYLDPAVRESLAKEGAALIARRAHLRRGHIRTLLRGTPQEWKVKVAPAFVKGVGFVGKDYKI
jgi:hypothetical protein